MDAQRHARATFIVNYSLTAFHIDRDSSSTTTTVDRRLDDGTVTLDAARRRAPARAAAAACTRRRACSGGPRAARHRDADADPRSRNRFHSRRDGTLTQTVGASRRPTTRAETTAPHGTSLARLNGEWKHRFGADGARRVARRRRPGARAGRTACAPSRPAAPSRARSRTRSRSRDTHAHRERQADRARSSSEHSLVAGDRARVEPPRRHARRRCRTARRMLTDFGDNIERVDAAPGRSTRRTNGA